MELEKVTETCDYDLDQLNWRDDETYTDATNRNDYLKGYNEDPGRYDFQQWANKEKKASTEVIPMHFNPEYLADYILMTWNGIDGTLQDLFYSMTLRYNNKLKEAVAYELEKRGYTVKPHYVDDRPMYAKKINKLLEKTGKIDVYKKLKICKAILASSEGLDLFMKDVEQSENIGEKMSVKQIQDLADYYMKIFPETYTLSLVKDYIGDKPVSLVPEYYRDFNLTDTSLMQTEKILSEGMDPYYRIDNGYQGYDYVSDMRGLDGTRPVEYEVGGFPYA